MSRYRKLTTACLAAALALGLAACGSSSSTKAPPGDDTKKPSPVSLAGVPNHGLTARTMTIEAGATETVGNVTFSCPSGGADCTVAITVTAGTATVTSDGGMATAAYSSAYVNARTAAANKMAKSKLDAINAEASQSTDAGLGGSDSEGNPVTGYSLAVTRDSDGTEVKIADTAMAGDDDPKFAQTKDLGSGTTMHVRVNSDDADGKVEEVVVVSTDIDAPKPVAFAKFKNAAGATPQALDVMKDDGGTPGGNETANALDIEADSDLTGAANMNLMFARSTTNGTLNYDRDDPGAQPTADVDEGLHDGTYNGAEGTYRCTASDSSCTVTFNAKGQVIGVSDNWVFIPDQGATSDQPDYNYLSYGFWLKKTTKDGETTYDEVEAFAMGTYGTTTTGSAGGELNDVEGSATYEGGATGVYVHNVLSSGGGTVASRTSGLFTADASLTAYFSGGSIPSDKHNTITGTINNFVLEHGEAQDWSVALKGTRATGANTVTGTANGGGTEGNFSGMFHGPTPLTPATDDENARVTPGSVAGEFNANFSNGSVLGAFGANKK